MMNDYLGELLSKNHAKQHHSYSCNYTFLMGESCPGCQTLISVLTLMEPRESHFKIFCALVFLLCQHCPIEIECELICNLKCSRSHMKE